MTRAARLHAPVALTPEGWASDVRVAIDATGRIAEVETGVAPAPEDRRLTGRALLPAPGNLHSHTFQRALAGLTEARTDGRDSFWTWRRLMYAFLEALTPDDIEAIAAQVMVENLEAGFAALGEFHYLLHAPGGALYDDIAETVESIAAAAETTGCGLTLLPCYYRQGGADGRALHGGQMRFGSTLDRFGRIMDRAAAILSELPADVRLGLAPHSLRAVPPADLAALLAQWPDRPPHIHAAEQTAEVDEVLAALGARPVEWLLANADLGPRWRLIHATHMTPAETRALAASGAGVGLCPITEANLGDGVFRGPDFTAAGGSIGFGSDSNLRLDLAGELRQAEYAQRLGLRARAVLCDDARSTGRFLLDAAVAGGAAALDRPAGLAVGAWADLLTLDTGSLALDGLSGDRLLDAWIFAGEGREVAEVWSAGRPVVERGRHVARAAVEARFRACVRRLRANA